MKSDSSESRGGVPRRPLTALYPSCGSSLPCNSPNGAAEPLRGQRSSVRIYNIFNRSRCISLLLSGSNDSNCCHPDEILLISSCSLRSQVIKGAPAGIRARRPTPPERRAAFSSTPKFDSLAPRVTRSTARQRGSVFPTAPGRADSPPVNVSDSRRRHK